MKISKTSRILSVYHLLLNCEEVSFQEFTLNFGVSQRTAPPRDIRLLKQAGVLEARWNRKRQTFVPVTLEPFPLEEQEKNTRQKYLEKLGYKAWYTQGFDDEPGCWNYEIPSAYGLTTIPGMRW